MQIIVDTSLLSPAQGLFITLSREQAKVNEISVCWLSLLRILLAQILIHHLQEDRGVLRISIQTFD